MQKILRCFLVLMFAVSPACRSHTSDSDVRDLFIDDAGDPVTGNARRRPATPDEMLSVILVAPHCTGVLVAETILLTADHCEVKVGDILTSGYALTQNRANDILVTKVLARDFNLDYALIQIRWRGPENAYPSQQKIVRCLATSRTQVQMNPKVNHGTRVYTVGFPLLDAPTWGATFSQGQLKTMRTVINEAEDGVDVGDRTSMKLHFDIGVRYGNSGGPVFAKHNGMLVAIVTAGVEGDKLDRADPVAWNSGPSAWQIFDHTKILQRLFPDGGRCDPMSK